MPPRGRGPRRCRRCSRDRHEAAGQGRRGALPERARAGARSRAVPRAPPRRPGAAQPSRSAARTHSGASRSRRSCTAAASAVTALLAAFERVAAGGAPSVVLVAGLRRDRQVVAGPRAAPAGWCSTAASSSRGKFDQYKRDIPYATIAQAFRELVLELLAGSRGRDRAVARAGSRRRWEGNGQLLVDVVPQLELLIGQQPARAGAAPSEAQHRFHRCLPAVPRRSSPDAGAPARAVPGRSAVGRPGQPARCSTQLLAPPRHRLAAVDRRLPRQRGDGRRTRSAQALRGDARRRARRATEHRARAAVARGHWPRWSPTPFSAPSAAAAGRWRRWCTRRPAATRSSSSSS